MIDRRTRQRLLTIGVAATLLALAACSSDDDRSAGGFDDPQSVIDAHIEAAREYDIKGDCELLTPDRRSELDGLELDTYCATVTAPIEADADDETKTRTRALYSDAKVTELDRANGTWFLLESADGSYTEQIETVEVDGRWWIGTIDSFGDLLDQDHAGEEPSPDGASEAPADQVGTANGS